MNVFNTITPRKNNYSLTFIYSFTDTAPSSLQHKDISFIHKLFHLVFWAEIKMFFYMFEVILSITSLYNHLFICNSCIIICSFCHSREILRMCS